MTFKTDYVFTDRETKAKYVWLKYQPLLAARSILDVGADKQYLKQYLDADAIYCGIGLGGNPDQQVDLEAGPIPFGDNSFDTVLCLDVLEHVDNIHDVFDELCRVSRRHVIISLPNAWIDIYQAMHHGDYAPGQRTKFYGLPLEKPGDRHKWFFSFDEAEAFIRYRTDKNGWRVVQIDGGSSEQAATSGLRTMVAGLLGQRPRYRKDLDKRNFTVSSVWAVLQADS